MHHLGNTPLISGSHCLFIPSPSWSQVVIGLLFTPFFQTSSPVSSVSFFCFLSSSAPLFPPPYVSPQLPPCDMGFLLLIPPRRRVSAPAPPKHQPLRLEAGQRGQRPVGEADGPLCGPPQVRWSHVSSQTRTGSGLGCFNRFTMRLHGYCVRSVSNSTVAGKAWKFQL